MSGDKRYSAFISYSHADEAIARKLHHKLETYRLPPRLVGHGLPSGASVPRRLKPVFRDRDELTVSSDLTEAVREALGDADALIIVCSPAAAQSQWVNQEIELFRSLNPTGRVLPIIAAGEPFASSKPDLKAQECFPPALLGGQDERAGRHLEPLAADLRRGGDGWRMAINKLVAGLYGLRLDEIIRRDLQRRNRNVILITGIMAAVTLSMSALTVFALKERAAAISARGEAEQRRSEAEDLIEFMLSDLQERLEPVGRLDVLDTVGAKVIEYYADQGVGALSADSLGRRARAYHLLGNIEEAEGDVEAAANYFRSAYEATRSSVALAPNDPDRVYEHSQSAYWVGYFEIRRGRYTEGEQYWLEYKEFSERLLGFDSDNLDWRTEAAYANANLGALYLEDMRPSDAQPVLYHALDLFLDIATEQVDSIQAQVDLADAYAWVADVEEVLDGRDAAIAARRRQVAMYENQLSGELGNWVIREDAINAENHLGRLLTLHDAALNPDDYQFGLSILESQSAEVDALIRHDAQNVHWRTTGIRQRLWLAQAHLGLERVNEARQAFLDASAMMAHPSWESDETPVKQEAQFLAALVQARLLMASSQFNAAETAYDHLLQDLQADDAWKDIFELGPYVFAAAINDLAEIAVYRQDVEAARELWERMLASLMPIRDNLQANAAQEYRKAEDALAALSGVTAE